jgi:ankyrin repeat protein
MIATIDSTGMNPRIVHNLYLACERDNLEKFLEILDLDPKAYEKSPRNGCTPTHTAARHGSVKILSHILSIDPEEAPCLRDSRGMTPAARAAEFNQVEALHLLLRSRPSVRFDVDDSGAIPLHRAARYGHHSVCVLLLSFQEAEQLAARDNNSETALFSACTGGHSEVVKLFLTRGARTDDVNVLGSTCLHVTIGAMARNCGTASTTLCLLLDYHANPDIVNSLGSTPLTLAIQRRLPFAIKLLSKRCDVDLHCPTTTKVAASMSCSKTGMLSSFLSFFTTSQKVKPKDPIIHTPLSQVLIRNDVEMIEAFNEGLGVEKVKLRMCELSSLIDSYELVGRHFCVVRWDEVVFCVDVFRFPFWWSSTVKHVVRTVRTGAEREVILQRNRQRGGERFFVVSDALFEAPLAGVEEG